MNVNEFDPGTECSEYENCTREAYRRGMEHAIEFAYDNDYISEAEMKELLRKLETTK